ncbi:class I SAM-dependent methyltransferase [Desulfovibrio inopinatus]|uniref:class I SAM-dependent methyltransferase n=1 Tax=Desulfovibrio inopinatus TaxID=102109 RepID=UPI0004027893|nr:class I SAM-dependent methyltransferase [Desulfovibrio inopinatus]
MDHFEKNRYYYDRNAESYEASSWYFFNRYKAEKVLEELTQLLDNIRRTESLRVLEIGPGTGYLLKKILEISKCRVRYVGIEHSAAMGEILKKSCEGLCESFELHCASASRKVVKDVVGSRRFDIVIGSSVLHHIPDYADLIDAIADTVDEGGGLYFVREPLHIEECSPPQIIHRLFFYIIDSLNSFMFKARIQKLLYPQKIKAESAVDIGVHMYKNGVSLEPFYALTQKGFSVLSLRKYNRRLTTFLSKLENVWCSSLRKDHFGNTLYSISMLKERI